MCTSVCLAARQLLDIFICRPQALARNWELNTWLERAETKQGLQQLVPGRKALTIAKATHFVSWKSTAPGTAGYSGRMVGLRMAVAPSSVVSHKCLRRFWFLKLPFIGQQTLALQVASHTSTAGCQPGPVKGENYQGRRIEKWKGIPG